MEVKQEVLEVEDSPAQPVYDVPSTSTSGGGASPLTSDYLRVEFVEYEDEAGVPGVYPLPPPHFLANLPGPSQPAESIPGQDLNIRPPAGGYKPGHKIQKFSESENDLVGDLSAEDLELIATAYSTLGPDQEDMVYAAHVFYLNGNLPGTEIY